MLLLETLGESLYRALASKDCSQRHTYLQLARTERLTSLEIQIKLGFQSRSKGTPPLDLKALGTFILHIRVLILTLSFYFFLLIPIRILLYFLQKILQRQSYSHWYVLFHDNDEKFWKIMKNHEDLQFQKLRLPPTM